MSENYKFFQNTKCEYFPCHKVENEKHFNCLFCFCPLYMLKDKCGGNFKYLAGEWPEITIPVNGKPSNIADRIKSLTNKLFILFYLF